MDQVVSVSSSILSIVSKIMTFKDDWVTVPDDYERQLEILKSRLHSYQEHVCTYGQPEDSSMMKILNKAIATLTRAETRVSRLELFSSDQLCCSHIRLWFAKLSIVFFPENIGKILKDVNDDIDSILKVLKEEDESSTQMRNAAKRRAIPTLVRDNDSLYVPIERVQSAVISAIQNSEAQHVVLLHGGIGKGKTTLARYMVQLYGKETMMHGNRVHDEENLFEQVIWVSCANCSRADIPAKQFEILQDHSPNSLGDTLSKEKAAPKRIAEALQNFLRAKKVLIILDDVSDAVFLYEMWMATSRGPDVKHLVTSQRSDICDSLKSYSVLIHMEDPTEDEAMKILVSLVGLEVIPDNLKVIAEKIIQAADKNPLALSCLASHFAYGPDKKNQRAWRDAHKELYKLLSTYKEGKMVLGSTPRSLWASMKLCLDNLETAGSRRILFFMYLCKGGSVPEAMLRIWHASSTFYPSKNELVMRDLLKPVKNSTDELEENDIGEHESQTCWSLGSLVKHYIKEQLASEKERNEMRSMVGKLVGDEVADLECESLQFEQTDEAKSTDTEKRRIAIVLCALYFDQSHTDMYEVVRKAMTRTSIEYSSDRFNNLRRQAIEPLVWLLDEPEEENWKEYDISCLRKVLLTYICKCQLDDENIAHLLKLNACTTAQLATLKAIGQICSIEEKPLLDGDSSLNFVQGMAQLMGSNEGLPTSVQVAAAWALRAVCCKAADDRSTRLIMDTPGVLDVLVSSLAVPNPRSDVIPVVGASSLCSLAYEGCEDSKGALKRIILNKKGALENLVKCITKHDRPDLQEGATAALANLATRSESNAMRIVDEEGTIEGLVELLCVAMYPKVQEEAARAIGNLAGPAAINLRIADQQGALAGLVWCLSALNNPQLLEYAAMALRNLAMTESIGIRIGHEEGAVESLGKLLFSEEDNLSEARKEAASALQNMAEIENSALQLRIAKDERALPGLVKCLAQQDHPDLQARAASVLYNLSKLEELRATVQVTEGLLKGLLSLVADDVPPDTQYEGVRALTLINPTAGKDASLTSGDAYRGRADALIFMGMYAEALPDLDQAIDLLQGATSVFCFRYFVKVKLGDLGGALDDANEAVKFSNSDTMPFALQERGIVKQMRGDLEGALADLEEGLKLAPDDYERLKYRGFTKFLMNDEEGARADAEWALRIQPPRVDRKSYGSSCLGTSPVEYLGYKLK